MHRSNAAVSQHIALHGQATAYRRHTQSQRCRALPVTCSTEQPQQPAYQSTRDFLNSLRATVRLLATPFIMHIIATAPHTTRHHGHDPHPHTPRTHASTRPRCRFRHPPHRRCSQRAGSGPSPPAGSRQQGRLHRPGCADPCTCRGRARGRHRGRLARHATWQHPTRRHRLTAGDCLVLAHTCHRCIQGRRCRNFAITLATLSRTQPSAVPVLLFGAWIPWVCLKSTQRTQNEVSTSRTAKATLSWDGARRLPKVCTTVSND